MTQPAHPRLPLIDLLKALAAQLVLLHHLVSYGPVAAAFEAEFPGISAWLFNQARMAVLVFLVIGGFLSGRALLSPEKALPPIAEALTNRYLRLALPFVAALTLSCLGAWFARSWLQDEFIPSAPGLGQILAHLFLLHSLLGYEALSTGVWYVAIDFQLFALGLLLVHLANQGAGSAQRQTRAVALIAGLTLASLFYFNRDDYWDNLAVYFFGAYGLGMLSYHITQARRIWPWVCLMIIAVTLALGLDYRARILLALLTALLLIAASRPWATSWLSALDHPWINHLGRTSYSLFLVHFSLILVGNALFAQIAPEHALKGTLALLLIWASSLLAAEPFYYWVEEKASRLRFLPRLRRPPA